MDFKTDLYHCGYDMEREIGRGVMAVVYLATQQSSRRVAVKIIWPAAAEDATFAGRLLEQGRALTRLHHPHLVSVFDVGRMDGACYLAMEYLDGGTLRDKIQQGLQIERAIATIRSVADALGYAHDLGLVHGDVKPGNILFRDNGEPVLTDLGIVAALFGTGGNAIAPLAWWTNRPRYMNPEQVLGRVIDRRSDIYNLGLIFYELLTGELPYCADDTFALAAMHISNPIPTLPAGLSAFQPLIDKLLAKDPGDRYQTTAEFVTALRDTEQPLTTRHTADLETGKGHPSSRAMPAWPWLAGSGAVLATLIAGIWWFGMPAPPINPAHDRTTGARTVLAPAATVTPLAATTVKQASAPPQHSAAADKKFVAPNAAPPSVAAAADMEAMLARADEQRRAHRLMHPPGDNAYESYHHVLQLDPANAKAHAGITAIAQEFLHRAEEERAHGKLRESLAATKQGLRVAPRHTELLRLLAQIDGDMARATAAQKQQVDDLLARAETQRRATGLPPTPGDIAYESYRRVLEIDPQNAQAKAAMEGYASYYERLGQMRQRTAKLEDVLAQIDAGLKVMPEHPRLRVLRHEVQTALAEALRTQAELPRQTDPRLNETNTKRAPNATGFGGQP